MKQKKTEANLSGKEMPYINLNSPQIKEQVEKMGKILKSLKQPIPSK
jgi:hypothetical protein